MPRTAKCALPLCLSAVMLGAPLGCGPSPMSGDWDGGGKSARPTPRPLGRDQPSVEPPRRPEEAEAHRDRFQPPTGTLTLPDALAAALRNNPQLASFAAAVRARQARALQAGLWPNPRMEVEAEEVGRRGNALENMENAVRLAQPILTAGKLEKRKRVAKLNSELAGWNYEAERLDVFTRVVRRFVGVLEAQRRVRVAERTLDLANQVVRTVDRQVEAGQVSPIERDRARAERSGARIELQRARRGLGQARIALAETWGGQGPKFDRAQGKLDDVSQPPPLSKLKPLIEQNPDVARWRAELAERRAEIDLAEARAWPNVTPAVGVQRFWGTEQTAGIFSVSVPLPIFDRNQGNILAERYELIEAAERRRRVKTRARSRLGQAYHRLSAAYQEVQTLRDETVPSARSAYESIRQSYKAGQRDLLDVLDAQRTLFEAKRRLVEALGGYQRHAAEVERAIAQSLPSVGAGPERGRNGQNVREANDETDDTPDPPEDQKEDRYGQE